MILVDANLLLYAKISSYRQHERVRHWFVEQLNSPAKVGLPWPSLLAFVRISINPRIFDRPLTFEAAWNQVTEWVALPCVWCPQPTSHHSAVFERVARGVSMTPKLVADAHLSALAAEHGLVLCSADSGFAQFKGLRWQNPLLDKSGETGG